MLEILFPSLSSIVSLTAIGVAFGLILSISKLKLKVEKDPRIEKVLEALPGANCGACGMPGCAAYATRIVEQKFEINLCPVGGAESADAIAEIMGMEKTGGAAVALKARVHCQGGIDVTRKKFDYSGPMECLAAHNLMGGPKMCEYGCLGFGDCVRSCPFDALHMDARGIPVVDPVKCTGCGSCVRACPRGIISLVDGTIDVLVMCRNREKGPVMKKGCAVGCIACKLCEKACREVFKDRPEIGTAIEIRDFLAEIDYSKCINCFKCVEVCPVPVIHPIERSKKMQKGAAQAQAASGE
ncbi:MAG: RnfABCDGE type electron transport complex subunit B [Spirochaetes bacterium]|nr:RnfABCDGE type electron transport complex subunit B [Spirochaetota bacterium]